jgi:hypothetical protein
MSYVKFGKPAKTYKRRKTETKVTMSITQRGQLVCNKACVEKYIKGQKYAELYYDRKYKSIGIKFTNLRSIDSFYLQTSNHVRRISCILFFNHFAIPYKETATFPAIWNKEESLLQISLGYES